METMKEDIERLSPERLMRMFSRSPIILAWILAVLAHIGIMAATSWEDMLAAATGGEFSWEKAKEEVVQTNATASATGTVSSVTGTVSVATNAVTVGTNITVVATNEVVEGSQAYEAEMMKKYSNSPIIQEITAVASSNEIPKGPPDDLGIKIEDTDPFNKK